MRYEPRTGKLKVSFGLPGTPSLFFFPIISVERPVGYVCTTGYHSVAGVERDINGLPFQMGGHHEKKKIIDNVPSRPSTGSPGVAGG